MTGFRDWLVVAQRKLVEILTKYPIPDNNLCLPGAAGSRRGSFDGYPVRCRDIAFVHAEQPGYLDAGNELFFPMCGVLKPQGTFYAMPDFRA